MAQNERFDKDQIYSTTGVADILKCSVSKVRRIIESGNLAATQAGYSGKKWIITGTELTRFLKNPSRKGKSK